MRELQACRACLATETKLITIHENNLFSSYEIISGITVSPENAMTSMVLPSFLCVECSTYIRKFLMFREKCQRAHDLLRNIPKDDNHHSLRNIKLIDRDKYNLKSKLSIWTSEKYSYKTYRHETILNSTLENDDNTDIDDKIIINNRFNRNIDDALVKTEDIDPKSILFVHLGDESIHMDDNYDDDDTPISQLDSIKKEPESGSDYDIELQKEIKTKKKRKVKKDKRVKDYFNLKNKLNSIKAKLKVKLNNKDQLINENIYSSDEEKLSDIKKTKKRTRKIMENSLSEEKWEIITHSEEKQIEDFNKKMNAYTSAPLHCAICRHGFYHTESLAVHCKRHEESSGELECHICKLRFAENKKYQKHVRLHAHRYKCKRCTFSTPSRDAVNTHEKFHSGVIYECKKCDLKFDKLSTFLGHKRLTHPSDFICPACGENFLSLKGLGTHRNRMHLENPRHIIEGVHCDTCDIMFLNSDAFKLHLTTSSKHGDGKIKRSVARRTDVLPVRTEPRKRAQSIRPGVSGRTNCEICGLKFPSDWYYVKHFKSAHPGETPREPYVCEVCGVRKSVWTNMRIHMAKHSEPKHSCDQCDAKFKTKGNLYRHQDVHNKEKAYQCSECGKRYTQKHVMKLHFKHVHLKVPYPDRVRKHKN